MTIKSQTETMVESLAARHICVSLGMSVKEPSYDELYSHLVKAGLSFINSTPGKLDKKIKHIDTLFKTLRVKDSKYVMCHGSTCFDVFGGPQPRIDVSQNEFDVAVGYVTFIESVVHQHATVNGIGIGSQCAHDAMCRSARMILEAHVSDIKSAQQYLMACNVLAAYTWNGIQYVLRVPPAVHKAFTTLTDMDTAQVPARSDIKIDVTNQRGHGVQLPETAVVVTLEGNEHYHFTRNDTQYVITRGYGKSPNLNPLQGAWICHEIFTGKYIDHDQYRSDLFQRLNLKIG